MSKFTFKLKELQKEFQTLNYIYHQWVEIYTQVLTLTSYRKIRPLGDFPNKKIFNKGFNFLRKFNPKRHKDALFNVKTKIGTLFDFLKDLKNDQKASKRSTSTV